MRTVAEWENAMKNGFEPSRLNRRVIDHQFYAERLRRAYAGPTIAAIRHSEPQATIADAYAIQALNRDHWRQAGRRIVGAKIGMTSKAVQEQLGIDQPDFGVLFADMQLDDVGTVPAGQLLQPKVEAEIAFCIGRDIDVVGDDPAELASAIAYALPALEIVDSRIDGWDIKMIDTIADNASTGMFVLGTRPVGIQGINLACCLMRLEKNGVIAVEGSGAACLGNPLSALAWLASMRIGQCNPLRAGEIILSGALGPMVAAAPGDSFRAHIDGVGSVSLHFASQ